MDKVTIIIPFYNSEAHLKRCIESAINQDYHNIEIVMVDDGSTDESYTISKGYELLFPTKCRTIRKEYNQGPSVARNSGLKVSTGEWIVFLDSDDWLEENYVSQMLSKAHHEEADIVVCNYFHAWKDGSKQLVDPFGSLNDRSNHRVKVALIRNHSCMKLFKKSLIFKDPIFFPEDIKRAEDMGFTIPLLTKTSRIAILKMPLYNYYQRMDSISNTNVNVDPNFYYEAFSVLKERVNPGFELEIEYRAILEFLYGLVMVLIRSRVSNAEITKHVERFLQEYPEWKSNKYLAYTSKLKKIIIRLASMKLILPIRIASYAYDKLQKKH